ncbi:MAG: 1-acyl-sn-glycerol-3-phosphate acyltransferase, partial [Pseudomonadota bacterium]
DRDQGTVEQGIATLKAALDRGDRLVLFAEGTSSDGQRVLPFRSSLFAAVAAGTRVQPVALRYTAPPGRDQRFYGWWAPMPFGPSLRTVLAQAPQGRVSLSFLPVRDAPGPTGRKSFAADLETAIRARFTAMGR